MSGIVPRFDNLNNKATEVNNRLVLMCAERKILFISHSESIVSSKHFNESKLHFSFNGVKVFAEYLPAFLTKFLTKLVCTHLNINSLRNKTNLLANITKDKIDILMISETKLDSSFPKGQFHLHGFSEPYRLDRNGNGDGILVFICEDIPSNLIE